MVGSHLLSFPWAEASAPLMLQNLESTIVPKGQRGEVGSGRPGSDPSSPAGCIVGQFLPFLENIGWARDTMSHLNLTGCVRKGGAGVPASRVHQSVCFLS